MSSSLSPSYDGSGVKIMKPCCQKNFSRYYLFLSLFPKLLWASFHRPDQPLVEISNFFSFHILEPRKYTDHFKSLEIQCRVLFDLDYRCPQKQDRISVGKLDIRFLRSLTYSIATWYMLTRISQHPRLGRMVNQVWIINIAYFIPGVSSYVKQSFVCPCEAKVACITFTRRLF